MKFLCLHGAASNSDILRSQLTPLMYELARTETVEFHFLNGPHEAPPYGGLGSQHPGPFFSFHGGAYPNVEEFVSQLQDLSALDNSPEERCRTTSMEHATNYKPELTVRYVQEYAKTSDAGPFDGLLGFSEGASVAANLLLDQERTSERPFKCGVFFCGGPPFKPGNGGHYLADECGEAIKIPTVHIFGARDLGNFTSLALKNLCSSENALAYEHSQGHEVPRAPAVTKRMATLIRKAMQA
ncbi:MAG: hypothetical protein LQ348_002365 [Seirophora lacunosa]|nr:MAG: hypothetical protein LQ348_002365 [Seirophora lacunosa]